MFGYNKVIKVFSFESRKGSNAVILLCYYFYPILKSKDRIRNSYVFWYFITTQNFWL